MRTFILIACLTTGGFLSAGPASVVDPSDLAGVDFRDPKTNEVVDVEGATVFAFEVAEGSDYILPDDHGDVLNMVEIRKNSNLVSPTLDVAGRQRDEAGRVIDAPPGSMDAAQTGMQHDGAGTVRNSISPEPTPSAIVQEQLAKADDPEALQHSPTEGIEEVDEDEE